MFTAGSDGTVKIWNFSNGSSLKNLKGYKNENSVDKEVTCLLCVHDPNDEEHIKPAFFVAAGWDKRLRIWPDDRSSDEENVKATRDLPNNYLSNTGT